MAAVTTRIVLALQNNLDGKSKQYKDPALTQLFLMNNIHYIVRSVRRFVLSHYLIEQVSFHFTYWYVAFNIYIFFFRSEAKDVLGDDWVQIQRRIVQQHANQYKRVSWAKVCSTTDHSQFSLQFFQFILVTFEAFTGICYLFLFPNPARY